MKRLIYRHDETEGVYCLRPDQQADPDAWTPVVVIEVVDPPGAIIPDDAKLPLAILADRQGTHTLGQSWGVDELEGKTIVEQAEALRSGPKTRIRSERIG